MVRNEKLINFPVSCSWGEVSRSLARKSIVCLANIYTFRQIRRMYARDSAIFDNNCARLDIWREKILTSRRRARSEQSAPTHLSRPSSHANTHTPAQSHRRPFKTLGPSKRSKGRESASSSVLRLLHFVQRTRGRERARAVASGRVKH